MVVEGDCKMFRGDGDFYSTGRFWPGTDPYGSARAL